LFYLNSTNKTDHHDTDEILLKVALNTIKQTTKYHWHFMARAIFLSWYEFILTEIKIKNKRVASPLSSLLIALYF
jgi:hypothetical protein